jgi:hypothetical protein
MRRLFNERLDLLINKRSCLVGIWSLPSHLVEHQPAIIFVEYLVAQLRAHTLLNHHFPGNLRRLA